MAIDRDDLAITLDKAFFILMKARIFDEKVPCTDPAPGSDAADDKEISILEDMPDDATYTELFNAIEALNVDEQIDLLALIWTGRGDFSVAEWQDARQAVRDMQDKHIARYIVRTPLVSDFLEEGLSMHGFSIEEQERKRL